VVVEDSIAPTHIFSQTYIQRFYVTGPVKMGTGKIATLSI